MKAKFLTIALALMSTVFVSSAMDIDVPTTQVEEGAEVDENEKVTFHVGADLVSAYLWRGQHCASISFQPTLGLEWRGLTLDAWGSTDFKNETNEVDWLLGYSIKGFSVGVTDYYFPAAGWNLIGSGGYFDWKKGSTGHQLEATVGYDFSAIHEKAAVSIVWNTIVYGNDMNDEGKQRYSTYLELGYSLALKHNFELAFAAGFTPWESMYQDHKSFNMVNFSVAGKKEFHFSDKFSMPVFAQVVINPNKENVYFACGLGF